MLYNGLNTADNKVYMSIMSNLTHASTINYWKVMWSFYFIFSFSLPAITALQMRKCMIRVSEINLVTMGIVDSSYDSQLH